MSTYNSYIDIYRYISEQAVNVDLSCYTYVYDDLVDCVAGDYLDLLRDKYNWFYGQELPEISEEEFWDLFKPYEI